MKEPSEEAIQSGREATAWKSGFDAGFARSEFLHNRNDADFPPKFWEDPANIRDLIAYLDQGDDGELDRKELLYLLEKPWKWEPEYNAMRAAEKEPK